MNDRELLELAAKAAGYEFKWEKPRGSDFGWLRIKDGDRWPTWRPLTDDGEALRLAVKLRMSIEISSLAAVAWFRPSHSPSLIDCTEEIDGDPAAATRRAIVRAAAEIGRRPVSGM